MTPTPRHRLRTLMLRLVMDTPLEPWLRRVHGRLARSQGARYDRETAAVMRRVLTPASNCADIGSYRGSILQDMVALAPRGRHFAFEPVPANYRYLAKRFPTVSVFNLALADYDGETGFQHVVGRPARSGLRRVAYPDPRQEVDEIRVNVKTLDQIIPADVKLDFVKIDVEGAELQVLRGASEVIRRSRPMMVFECGSERAAAFGVKPEEVYDVLTEDLGLQVSLMRRWLDGGDSLSRHEFCHLQYAKVEFCFLAYVRA